MHYIPVEALGAFAFTCLVIELTPGPNMAYLAVLSASNGRWVGFVATLGIALGLLIVGIGAALGLTALIASSHLLYEALRWFGVAYLLWLAWDGWHDASETSAARAEGNGIEAAAFTRGLVANLLNPKAGVSTLQCYPEFVDPAQPVLAQTILLSAVYVFVATAVHTTMVSLAGTARPLLDHPDRSRILRRGLSLMLGVIAVWFAFSTAR
jgi:threonine/homoserine/homoserine lactone efflux protein